MPGRVVCRSHVRRALGASAWIAAAACAVIAHAAPPQPLADEPMVEDWPLPGVVIHIGKQSARCIVDTGSSFGVINGALSGGAETLQRVKVAVAYGKDVWMPIVRLRDVSIGEARRRFTDFLRRDSGWFDPKMRAPCVLGGSFLDSYTVEFDFVGHRLRLFERGTRIADLVGSARHEVALLPTRPGSGRIEFEVHVAGVKANAFLDTGWPTTGGNAALLEALGVVPEDPRVTTSTETTPSGIAIMHRGFEPGPIRIGAQTFDRVKVDFGPYAVRSSESAARPFLHVGVNLLAGHRLFVDMAGAEVAIVRDPRAGVAPAN
jgi:hypothetical protein